MEGRRMILRNKKTGKLGHLLTTKGLSTYDIIDDVYNLLAKYNSLDNLCAEWEDYKPTKPLIKDRKARSIIKKWHNKNNIVGKLHSYGGGAWLGLRGDDKNGNSWKIELHVNYDSQLEYGELYSLTELIGEKK